MESRVELVELNAIDCRYSLYATFVPRVDSFLIPPNSSSRIHPPPLLPPTQSCQSQKHHGRPRKTQTARLSAHLATPSPP
jgi:hypothetical protein